jgi:hypothetical protein
MRTAGAPKSGILGVADSVGAYAEPAWTRAYPCVLLERAYGEMVAPGVLGASPTTFWSCRT